MSHQEITDSGHVFLKLRRTLRITPGLSRVFSLRIPVRNLAHAIIPPAVPVRGSGKL